MERAILGVVAASRRRDNVVVHFWLNGGMPLLEQKGNKGMSRDGHPHTCSTLFYALVLSPSSGATRCNLLQLSATCCNLVQLAAT